MIWYLKSSASGNYTEMPEPTKLTVDGEDIDIDSYRNCINGNLVRNILGYKWQKIGFELNYKSENDIATMVNYLKNTYPLYLKVKSPLFRTAGTDYTELVGYVSQIHFEYVKTLNSNVWTLTFNFVEGTR